MSDTSGLPNTNAEGVPSEDQPERFENGEGQEQAQEEDAQAAEPAETEPGQGRTVPEGAEDVTEAATTGAEGAEPPPAEFDPAQQPSNPDLVDSTEPPD
jgi:hypothetical protein